MQTSSVGVLADLLVEPADGATGVACPTSLGDSGLSFSSVRTNSSRSLTRVPALSLATSSEKLARRTWHPMVHADPCASCHDIPGSSLTGLKTASVLDCGFSTEPQAICSVFCCRMTSLFRYTGLVWWLAPAETSLLLTLPPCT